MKDKDSGRSPGGDGLSSTTEPVSAVSALRASIPSALSDLVGQHVLECVPNLEIRHPTDTDGSGVLFTLSGRTYLVFEDPSDGYRSSAGPLMSFAGSAYEIGGSWYPDYILEEVLCSIRTTGEYGTTDDVLEMRSVETGALIFEVGTKNVDDYYPSFICRWHPSGLSANSRARL